MVLTAGGADGANCCSRNLWIFGIGDPLNIGMQQEGHLDGVIYQSRLKK